MVSVDGLKSVVTRWREATPLNIINSGGLDEILCYDIMTLLLLDGWYNVGI